MGMASMPTDRRPILHAVITAVPEPEKGSMTDRPPDISRHFSTNDDENSSNLNRRNPARPLLPLRHRGSVQQRIHDDFALDAACMVKSRTPPARCRTDSY